MAKFYRSSLLLALCVTVIISPWMPLSQCVEPPSTDDAPPITRTECEKWAKQLHRQIFSEKMQTWKNLYNEIAENVCNPKQERVEQDSESKCGIECSICRKVLLRSDITDVVGCLYEKEPDIDCFQKCICEDGDKNPSPSKLYNWMPWIMTSQKMNNKVCVAKHKFPKNHSPKSNEDEL